MVVIGREVSSQPRLRLVLSNLKNDPATVDIAGVSRATSVFGGAKNVACLVKKQAAGWLPAICRPTKLIECRRRPATFCSGRQLEHAAATSWAILAGLAVERCRAVKVAGFVENQSSEKTATGVAVRAVEYGLPPLVVRTRGQLEHRAAPGSAFDVARPNASDCSCPVKVSGLVTHQRGRRERSICPAFEGINDGLGPVAVGVGHFKNCATPHRAAARATVRGRTI